MKSDHEANDIPDSPSSLPTDNDLETGLEAECERLRRRVAELEAERQRDLARLTNLKAERDQSRADGFVHGYIHASKELDPEGVRWEAEFKRALEQDQWYPFETILDDLERINRES